MKISGMKIATHLQYRHHLQS